MNQKMLLSLELQEIKIILSEADKPANKEARRALPNDDIFVELLKVITDNPDAEPTKRFSLGLTYEDSAFITRIVLHSHHEEHEQLKLYLEEHLSKFQRHLRKADR